jgi:hypothetical protein
MSAHECSGDLPYRGYGEAISSCEEMEDGTLWISNSEYASQVNYCPYCGFKAKAQMYIHQGFCLTKVGGNCNCKTKLL